MFCHFPASKEGLQIVFVLEKGVEAIQNRLFSGPEGDAVFRFIGAAHVAEFVVFEFLQFQQVEDFLGFEDAIGLQQQFGEESVVSGDGVGEGLLEVGVEAAQVAAYRFADINAGFEAGDG